RRSSRTRSDPTTAAIAKSALPRCSPPLEHGANAGAGAPRRRARAGPRRLGDFAARNGSKPRLPADGPHRGGGEAATARSLEPARFIRPCRARPAPLGGQEPLRVERVHLADRGPPADPGTNARALGSLQVATVGKGV